MRHLLYIDRDMAKASGLTHEGTLFGVPAWFDGDDSNDEIAMATPKVPLLHLWCAFADLAYAIAANFMPPDAVLRSPIRITRRI